MKTIKYFFEFLTIISLLSIFKIIGLENASSLGGLLGRYIGPVFRSKNLVKKNLEIGLGKLNQENQEKIISEMWSNIGRSFAEYVHLNKFKNSFNRTKINGLNYVNEIKNSSKPVIFYTGHFSNFELIPMELNKLGIKLAILFRPLNNFFLDPLLEHLRKKYTCPIIIPKGKTGAREVVNKLNDGYSIALTVDQRISEGPRISFFGKPAHTTTFPAQLALKYNYKLVPVSIERKNDANFEMTIHAPYEIKATDNNEEDKKEATLKINQTIEKIISNNPTQWLWSHNRWK